MRVSSAYSSGVEGISRATAMLDEAAAQTLEATVPTDTVSLGGEGDLISASTERANADLMMRANVKVLQSAQQMDDVLLQLLMR